MTEYQASGGTSRVFQVGEHEELQIEVHPQDYAVLWPTQLNDSEASMRLGELLPTKCVRGVVHVDDEDSHRIFDLSDQETLPFINWVHSELGPVDFVRIDYDDRVLTWERKDDDHRPLNEMGFLTAQFDPSYLVELVRSTATPGVLMIAEQAINQAVDIVQRFPSHSLFPEGLSHGTSIDY